MTKLDIIKVEVSNSFKSMCSVRHRSSVNISTLHYLRQALQQCQYFHFTLFTSGFAAMLIHFSTVLSFLGCTYLINGN